MSKTMNMTHRNIRWKLMTTASALALSASVYGTGEVRAADADRPTLWIELGGQMEQVKGFGDPYAPPFTSEIVADGFFSPLKAQQALSQSFGEEGSISFQPENSDWIFSASMRYGRANGGTAKHEQTPGCPCKVVVGTHSGYVTPAGAGHKFSETRVSNSETHAILDFQAGKDIGLGLLGRGGRSAFGFGVRIAQFDAKQALGLNADPDFYFPSKILKYAAFHHTYAVTSHIQRSFRGAGPSISWNASAPLIGNSEDGGITLDWGVNAAVLFGRQKMHGHHQTTGAYYKTGLKYHLNTHIARSGNPDRSRAVTVPNLGGFAGLSLNWANAKISIGYRADFFFNAIDGGIDTRKTENRGFFGPYANISIGIGD
jgi:iron complex outermembrane recepter protein